MKKVFSVLAAMLLATAVSPVHAELSQDGLIAVEHFNKLETCFNDMTAVLMKVTDKESADAQAPAFIAAAQALTLQLAAMQGLEHELTGQPNADDEAAFEQCRNNLHIAGMAMQAELRRLAMVNFYESEVFVKALLSLQQGAE